jgi:hypothetical protein
LPATGKEKMCETHDVRCERLRSPSGTRRLISPSAGMTTHSWS